jgi:hypothetical protein
MRMQCTPAHTRRSRQQGKRTPVPGQSAPAQCVHDRSTAGNSPLHADVGCMAEGTLACPPGPTHHCHARRSRAGLLQQGGQQPGGRMPAADVAGSGGQRLPQQLQQLLAAQLSRHGGQGPAPPPPPADLIRSCARRAGGRGAVRQPQKLAAAAEQPGVGCLWVRGRQGCCRLYQLQVQGLRAMGRVWMMCGRCSRCEHAAGLTSCWHTQCASRASPLHRQRADPCTAAIAEQPRRRAAGPCPWGQQGWILGRPRAAGGTPRERVGTAACTWLPLRQRRQQQSLLRPRSTGPA